MVSWNPSSSVCDASRLLSRLLTESAKREYSRNTGITLSPASFSNFSQHLVEFSAAQRSFLQKLMIAWKDGFPYLNDWASSSFVSVFSQLMIVGRRASKSSRIWLIRLHKCSVFFSNESILCCNLSYNFYTSILVLHMQFLVQFSLIKLTTFIAKVSWCNTCVSYWEAHSGFVTAGEIILPKFIREANPPVSLQNWIKIK